MPADFLHFVRHGEVANPEGILYGRLEGFGLSPRGHEMAKRSADALATRPITKILSSPLQRAVESATPLATQLKLEIEIDERLLEGLNDFEGSAMSFGRLFREPSVWKKLYNPWKPSWGEPYREISQRVMALAEDAWNSVDEGEVVLVSHQVVIWILHRSIAGIPLPHLPNQRRCSLSSITTVKKVADRWKEESYREPAADLLEDAIDLGAV
ncbi:MAG: histidine phosphatase family protein [Microbacteriaceae bacterium]|nr:histidine phosphatase family protein [Microbacteriaceae bacterium]